MKQFDESKQEKGECGNWRNNCAFKNCSDHFYILKSVSTGTWCAGSTPHTYV